MLAATFAERAGAQAASTKADEAAIAEFNRRYVRAINDGDIETLASLTTKGHMITVGGAAAHRQAGARRRDQAHTPDHRVRRVLGAGGDRRVGRSRRSARHFVVAAKPKAGGAETRITGNFLRIYRKIDGAWFMVRDSFNALAAARTAVRFC